MYDSLSSMANVWGNNEMELNVITSTKFIDIFNNPDQPGRWYSK